MQRLLLAVGFVTGLTLPLRAEPEPLRDVPSQMTAGNMAGGGESATAEIPKGRYLNGTPPAGPANGSPSTVAPNSVGGTADGAKPVQLKPGEMITDLMQRNDGSIRVIQGRDANGAAIPPGLYTPLPNGDLKPMPSLRDQVASIVNKGGQNLMPAPPPAAVIPMTPRGAANPANPAAPAPKAPAGPPAGAGVPPVAPGAPAAKGIGAPVDGARPAEVGRQAANAEGKVTVVPKVTIPPGSPLAGLPKDIQQMFINLFTKLLTHDVPVDPQTGHMIVPIPVAPNPGAQPPKNPWIKVEDPSKMR